MILSRRPSSDQPAQPMENTELLILTNPTSLDKIVQSLQYVLYPNMLLHWEDSGMNSAMSHMQKFVASNLSQSLTSFQSLHGRKPEKCWKTTAYLPNNYPPYIIWTLHIFYTQWVPMSFMDTLKTARENLCPCSELPTAGCSNHTPYVFEHLHRWRFYKIFSSIWPPKEKNSFSSVQMEPCGVYISAHCLLYHQWALLHHPHSLQLGIYI